MPLIYIIQGQYDQKLGGYQQGSEEGVYNKVGHGAHYYYIHQQLLARYNLERLGQGLGPIKDLDYYYEHIETPFKPNLRYLNGVNFPGRDEHSYITPRHHNYELLKLVRNLEKRIIEAIDLGHVITPQGAFLSLYQPQGLNILGELIEGTGRSINPRYYGSFQYVARQLLGNAAEFNDIWEYAPSALELGQTAVRDPIFYQLYNKIIELFHYYQESLPAYQYNDLVVPGVTIEKVEVSDLITYFSNYEVDLNNAVIQPVGQNQEQQPYPKVKAQLKRLDHKQYEYSIYVQSQKVLPGAVVRVYVGPKYNYDGQPIDINTHRHYFYELDQFIYDCKYWFLLKKKKTIKKLLGIGGIQWFANNLKISLHQWARARTSLSGTPTKPPDKAMTGHQSNNSWIVFRVHYVPRTHTTSTT